MAKATAFKFGVQIDYKDQCTKKQNQGTKKEVVRSCNQLINVRTLYISGTAKGTNFKFALMTDY